jgi:cell division protein ZapA
VAEVDIAIAGRSYRIACRDGEEENLRKAASIVDAKSREALAGLGTLSEARQFLFASLLLADQLIDDRGEPANVGEAEAAERAERIAERLESLAARLEGDRANA